MLCLFSNCAPFSTCVVGEGTKNSTLWSPAKGLLQTNTAQLAWLPSLQMGKMTL